MRLISEESLKRKFIDNKVSKVKFLLNENDDATGFVTGSWDSVSNSLSLWEIKDNLPGISKASELKIDADVNDIFVQSTTNYVTGLSNGDVKLVNIKRDATMVVSHTFNKVHKTGASSAVCVVQNEIFSGSDTGSIVRIPLGASQREKISLYSSDLMGVQCMTPCGPHQFVSGHVTGQIHQWDTRQEAVALSTSGQSHHNPVTSKAVTTINDAITALASHPAQPNVLAYGTASGSVSFVDVRQPSTALPSLFKVCQDSINCLKFHPNYTNNCFSSSASNVVHWDAATMNGDGADESLEEKPLDSSLNKSASMDHSGNGVECSGGARRPSSGHRQPLEHHNIWLSSRVWNNLQLKALLEDDPKFISCFDVSRTAIIVGSDTCNLVLLENLNFC